MTDDRFKQMDAEAIAAFDPLNIEIEPGFIVRDLADRKSCENAVFMLGGQINQIMGQIARNEGGIEDRPAGWRTNAQNAIRWKKRAIAAIRLHEQSMAKPATSKHHLNAMRRQAIIDVIEDDLGTDAIKAYVAQAQAKNPALFQPVENGDYGENG